MSEILFNHKHDPWINENLDDGGEGFMYMYAEAFVAGKADETPEEWSEGFYAALLRYTGKPNCFRAKDILLYLNDSIELARRIGRQNT